MITQNELDPMISRFEQIIGHKTNELEGQKRQAKSENNIVLYYALENVIYNLSLIDGYLLLSKNYRYNAADTLIRTIYETLFQNIFIYRTINNGTGGIDELKEVFSKTNELIKSSNKDRLNFLKIEQKYKDLEYNKGKKVVDYMHRMRKIILDLIKKNDNTLPKYDFVNYGKVSESFLTKSDISVHNTLFINSINEGKFSKKMNRIMIVNTSYFLLFNLYLINDILKVHNRNINLEEESFLRENIKKYNEEEKKLIEDGLK